MLLVLFEETYSIMQQQQYERPDLHHPATQT